MFGELSLMMASRKKTMHPHSAIFGTPGDPRLGGP